MKIKALVEPIASYPGAGPVHLDHKFGPDLNCPCGTSWREHQETPTQCKYDNGRCSRGHLMTPANTYKRGTSKDCITCKSLEAKLRKGRESHND